MSDRKTPPHNARKPQTPSAAAAANELRRAARHAETTRRQAQECVKLVSMPVQHAHAAGIDAGDISHWACVESTPDDSDTVREFPAHTAGLRQLVDWLRRCGVSTVALEAKAITATAHKLARIVYNLVRYGLAYMKQTEQAYAAQVRERLERQLRRRATELGYELKKIEPPVVASVT